MVDAGGAYGDNTSVNLPQVPVGNYYLIVVADADGNVDEEDESNNTAAFLINVVGPDFRPTACAPTEGVLHAGETGDIDYTIENEGQAYTI